MKNLDTPDNYLSHKNLKFNSKNKEKFIFNLIETELKDIKLLNPNKQEINTYMWTKKEEQSINKYEIDVNFHSKGKYNVIFCLFSCKEYKNFNLEYLITVEEDMILDKSISQNNFGLVPLNHKDFNFVLKNTNTLCLHFKKDDNKKYEIIAPRSLYSTNPKILTTKIPNEIFYTIGFKEEGKYRIRIICEDSGIFKQLVYNISCEKKSEYDYVKHDETM